MIIRIAKVCADGNKLYFQKDRLFPVDRLSGWQIKSTSFRNF